MGFSLYTYIYFGNLDLLNYTCDVIRSLLSGGKYYNYHTCAKVRNCCVCVIRDPSLISLQLKIVLIEGKDGSRVSILICWWRNKEHKLRQYRGTSSSFTKRFSDVTLQRVVGSLSTCW